MVPVPIFRGGGVGFSGLLIHRLAISYLGSYALRALGISPVHNFLRLASRITTPTPHRFLLQLGLLCLFVSGVFGLIAPASSMAAPPCPGAVTFYGCGGGACVGMARFANTSCTAAGVPFGAATGCLKETMAFSSNFFRATWPSNTARTMDPSGGCDFMCASFDCTVDTSGLPVELMGFEVE